MSDIEKIIDIGIPTNIDSIPGYKYVFRSYPGYEVAIPHPTDTERTVLFAMQLLQWAKAVDQAKKHP